MTSQIKYDEVEVGAEIPAREYRVLRVQLLKFCGACCDYTATHWNERVAKSVDLPNVISHGTLNIAHAVRTVSEWIGDPGQILEYRTKFTRSVVVPDDDEGALLRVSGVIKEKLDGKRIRVRLTAECAGVTVMAGTDVVARLA